MRRLLAVLAVVPASLVLSDLGGGPGNLAQAKPEFAAREKKECTFCHKNPKGGMPLLDKGLEYKKNGFKFIEVKGFGQDGAFANEANAKAFELVTKAIDLGHYVEAFKRLGELKSKEKKGTPGAQLLLNTERQVDGKGTDLARAARDAVQSGKVPEAAEALIRVETEFKGRDPAKDIVKVRTDFAKLTGAKEADVAARAVEPQRISWLDAQMREIEGKKPEALKILTDLVTKFPDGPFASDARKKIEELGGKVPAPAVAPPAMGGG
jgi:hypothetical protein